VICYEVIDDAAVASIAKSSNLMIVQVENNRWVVSISTTGVSAIIDNHGQVQQLTKQNTAAYLSSEVDLITTTTVANKLGNWTAAVCIFMASIVYIGKRRKDA